MKPILLATDGSSAAAEATEKAIELANAVGAPLFVASIWDVDYAPVGYGVGMAPVVPDLDRIGQETAEEVVETAARAAREAGVEVETILRRGIPTQLICDIADEKDVQLIAVGSHGWGAFRRMVFGSVSTGVLHHAKQPVLVVPARTTSAQENGEHALVEVEV